MGIECINIVVLIDKAEFEIELEIVSIRLFNKPE